MAHDHDHTHHDHGHARRLRTGTGMTTCAWSFGMRCPNSGLAFAVGSGVNGGFVVLQVVFGLLAGSVALLADALHNLGDVLGLLLAWGAAGMGRWRPTGRHTYGFGPQQHPGGADQRGRPADRLRRHRRRGGSAASATRRRSPAPP